MTFVTVGLFAVSGLVDRELVLLVIAHAVALPIGWRLGAVLFDRLSPRQFRIGMLSMLVLSASVALVTAR